MRIIKRMRCFALTVMTATLASPACADAPGISSGDTAWVLICAAMVMLMTPGLGLFYGGMVRRKNVLATILQSFVMVGIISLQWVLVGYTLAFGPDKWGIIGGLDWAGLKGVGFGPGPYSDTIPHMAFMIFQAMFAIITPALITGAFAERMKFKAFVIFALLWATLVYDPICHWVWAPGGWLGEMGALDFAGGTVVHISSGIAALACVISLGRRKGYGKEEMKPHNLTMTLIGAALLWFGWFGFNAGSALAANGVAATAFVVTNTSAAAGALAWMAIESRHRGKPTALGAASGAVAGLVAITPAAGFVGAVSAILIGAVAGVLCYFAIITKGRLGYDDSLDVFGIHGVGGIWGALAVGIFASTLVNPEGADGLLRGNLQLLPMQVTAVVAAACYSFSVTWVLLKIVNVFSELRVSHQDEDMGLDLTQHGEIGYSLMEA